MQLRDVYSPQLVSDHLGRSGLQRGHSLGTREWEDKEAFISLASSWPKPVQASTIGS